MEIRIAIEKKHLWFIVLAVVAVGFVVAFGGTNPQQMGHSIGEIDGLDQKITDVVAPQLQAGSFLSGKQLAEVTLFSIGTQAPLDPPIDGRTSFADYVNVYGRRNSDSALEQRGCESAITRYCQVKQYSAAIPIGTSCGWGFANDRPCPDVAGCTVSFFCVKLK